MHLVDKIIIVNGRLIIVKISKSFAYIAIIIARLDVLKYFFGIDSVNPICKEFQSTKRKTHRKKNQSVSIIRFMNHHHKNHSKNQFQQ